MLELSGSDEEVASKTMAWLEATVASSAPLMRATKGLWAMVNTMVAVLLRACSLCMFTNNPNV